MRVAVIGAGAWGTALSLVARRASHEATLWAFEPEVAEEIDRDHRNSQYLPGIELDPAVTASADVAAVAEGAELALLVTPAQEVRRLAGEAARSLPGETPILICAKGIEEGTGALLADAVGEAAPGHPVAVLSGPTFAREVAMGLPTAVTIAAADHDLAARLVLALKNPALRPYSSGDPVGVQVGGAVKNVIAIAAGVSQGLQMGENARAALVTRGLAEIVRLGVALGGRSETFLGLSGVGDLMLTCASEQSRNTSLGVELGRGRSPSEVLAGRHSVAEGMFTAAAVDGLAKRLGIEVPITTAVHRLLAGELTCGEAMAELLERPVKAENDWEQ